MGNNLSTQAAGVVTNANFREAWPIEARRVLVKAARTEGADVPAYAEREVRWAIRTAEAIENRLDRQVSEGEALLPKNRRAAQIG